MKYQRHEQPGCGGCLLIAMIVILVTGGAPALINFVGALIFSGFAGVLLFIAIFWGFTYWMQKQVATYEQSQSESHNRFVWLLVQILIRIAKIDGEISRDEVQAIQRFFQYNLHYNQTQMTWVKELIKEATASSQTLDSLLQEFKATFAYEPRLILLELIYQILYTKSRVPPEELQIARNIANFLEISSYDLRTIEAKFTYRQQQTASTSRNMAEQYYAVLGLEPGTDMESVKKAYRKLCMQFHPDKVSHLGDEFKAVAEEKMKEINQAYDYFKKM
ncbi:MAG: TerB family tellurite resistance protein [Desulfoprunum sp.]|nr:TerB family tellurite resistance protein [Desulfoprunum sp.]